MEEVTLESLKRQRGVLKGQITRITASCQSDALQVSKAKAFKARLEHYMLEFERVQILIETLLDEEAELPAETRYRVEIEEAYYENCARLSDIIDAQNDAPGAASDDNINKSLQALADSQCALTEMMKTMSEANPRRNPINITKVEPSNRLPQPKLPEFNGSFGEWIRFRDLFVGSKENISGAEKMEYLFSCLKGDTSSVIKHLPPSDANYEAAWALLHSLYDKPQFIMIAHLDNLFDFPPLKGNGLDEIKSFFRLISENINALRALKKPVDSWNEILLYILAKKMDEENRVLWARCNKENESPTIDSLINFLKDRMNELESLCISRNMQVNRKVISKPAGKRVLSASVQSCIKSKRNHHLYQCDEFRSLPVSNRIELVKASKICANCLRVRHEITDCKFSSCKHCSQRHNSLLHQENSIREQNLPGCSRNVASGIPVHSINVAYQECYTLLPTAIVFVVDSHGQLHKCRALLDSGSQSTLITERCAQMLNLKRSHAKIPIVGIGQNGGSLGTKGMVRLVLHSSGESQAIISTNAFILPILTGNLPALSIPKKKLHYFDNLRLADPECFTSSKIDILLGSDVFFDILTEGRVVHPSGSPTAHNTAFGWVIAGNISPHNPPCLNVFSNFVDLDYLLQRFWEYEDVQEKRSINCDNYEKIENHFMLTHFVKSDGRYVVRLPFKTADADVELGDSRNTALRVLYAMERKFVHNPQLKVEYVEFMREYETLGHMAPIPSSEVNRPSFYMPHHAVLKPSSTTTKLRVVFNASSRSSNGVSLNDSLLVGPVIQTDLVTSLINFRKDPIAVKADIAKMYRQILVSESDVDFQRIVWRENPEQMPIDYRLLTLTYGTSPASFIATRVLKQIGVVASEKHPHASNSLQHHFYVDDYSEGFCSTAEAIETKNELCEVLEASGMQLRKWSSNSTEFLTTIEPECLEISTDLPMGDSSVKMLGLVWDTEADIFKFSLELSSTRSQITKRQVLSDIARIFDPLGTLSPVVIKMKILMQELWVKGVGWDEVIPTELLERWIEFRDDLRNVSLIRIPRWLQYERGDFLELHGFADASESAYAAAVFCRIKRADGRVFTSLICAKTRVSPARAKLTIPKLELCGALLLPKLLSKTKEALDLQNIECFAYTDSTIVLQWIQGYPRPRNVFADNRLSQIATQLPSSTWHYVRSAENPADCGTRGIMPKQLPSLDLWWKGPLFIQEPVLVFTRLPYSKDLLEEDGSSCFACSAETEWKIFESFSSLIRILRVVARCIRLIRKYRKPRTPLKDSRLAPHDISLAKTALLRVAQRTSFPEEIECLLKGKPIPTRSKIFNMCPFIDEAGVLRVGGRLSNANIPFDQKHPIILHKNHRLTYLIVLECHARNMHPGTRQMTYLLSLNHYIVGVHHVIKSCIYKCSECMRQRAIPYKQQMGELPKQRLEPGTAFNHTFTVASWKGRGAKRFKTYIALFVCLATKALHLEAVTELTSDAFVAALRRFVARRGRCHSIYSDNGTNFVGANNQLQEWANEFRSTQFQENITNELTHHGINWYFIPPHAPHFGGLWEAGVKTGKYHLRRVLGSHVCTYEEFTTILCQIEACANSRPLCNRFEGDVDPLTPGHFLILRPLFQISPYALKKQL